MRFFPAYGTYTETQKIMLVSRLFALMQSPTKSHVERALLCSEAFAAVFPSRLSVSDENVCTVKYKISVCTNIGVCVSVYLYFYENRYKMEMWYRLWTVYEEMRCFCSWRVKNILCSVYGINHMFMKFYAFEAHFIV